MSRFLVPVLVISLGVGVMAAAVFEILPGQIGVVAIGFGFLIVVAGLVIAVTRTLSQRSSGTRGEANRGLRLRLLFGAVALGSLGLPLIRVPPEAGAPLATGIELLQAIVAGNQTTTVLLGSVFVAVLLGSVFVGVLTDLGGGLILLDLVGLTVLASDVSGRPIVDVMTGVFGIGVYVLALAAVALLGTRFVSTDETGEAREWSPIHR
jgi:hypothetical protein